MIETQKSHRNPTASERIRIRRYARESENSNTHPESLKKIMVLGASLIALGFGVKGYQKVTAPGSHTVTEIVQTGDSPWTLAQKAEAEYGKHPDAFNVQEEADRIAHDNDVPIQPGEEIEVQVK